MNSFAYILFSESTLSHCIIAGALEGTRFGLGIRQLSLKLQTTMAEGKASRLFYREQDLGISL